MGDAVEGARRERVEAAQRRVLTELSKLEAAMANAGTNVAAAAVEARVARVASRQEATLASLATLDAADDEVDKARCICV